MVNTQIPDQWFSSFKNPLTFLVPPRQNQDQIRTKLCVLGDQDISRLAVTLLGRRENKLINKDSHSCAITGLQALTWLQIET